MKPDIKRAVRSTIGPRLGLLVQHKARPLRVLPSSPRRAGGALPSIGIVTPSYQQGRFIAATIDSVAQQNYAPLQYYVQDGGSTDHTAGILQANADKLSGWASQRDGGQSHALNLGFARLDSDIMGYLNSDDILLPDALKTIGHFFRQHPEIDVVYGNRLLIDEEGQEIGTWRLPYHSDRVLDWADFVPQETLFWRRSAWIRAGGAINEEFSFAMDWDLIIRLRDSGARFAHIRRFLGAFRVHTRQKTAEAMPSTGNLEMARIRRRTLGFEPTRSQMRMALAPFLAAQVLVDGLGRASDWAGVVWPAGGQPSP